MQRIRRNFGLKLLALALAIVGWAYFRFATNPIVAAARFDRQISVPITAVNLPDGYIAHYTDKDAVVTVESKRGEPEIKPDEIKAVLDLANKETGVYNVPVALVAPEVPVQSLSPASVTLSIERVEDRPFTVSVHYLGYAQNGVVVGDVRLSPNNAVLHGPISALAQVAAVRADVTLPSSPKLFDGMVRPVAVNTLGVEVSGLTVTPELVRVRAHFVAGSGSAEELSRLFGTDGVRGVANADLTPELAFALGRAAATVLAHASERHRPVVVGRDTRLSGTMLEAAIVAGITSVGRDVVTIGIVPTPAVACVTRRVEGAAGLMISASHNPIADNGIKIFGADGFKLSDDAEREIEALVDSADLPRPIGTDIGVARAAANLARHYYEELYESHADLHGLHVVVDAAFGSAYAIAPYALRKLGATVSEINCENDGARINVGCGATDLSALQNTVRDLIAAGEERVLGVAFDGDADRALFVDETGAMVSGDHVMFAIGRDMHARGELSGNAIVGTVMSNIGFERALRAHGIDLVRAPVGDRYVIERMRAGGYALGGEQSGHVIDFRRNTTGDGPMTAATLFGIVARNGSRLHDLVREVVVAPQVLVNVRTSRKDVLELPAVRAAIAQGEALLGDTGRLLIRPSGTEPLIRVMAEGDDRALVENVAARIASRIEEEIGSLTKI